MTRNCGKGTWLTGPRLLISTDDPTKNVTVKFNKIGIKTGVPKVTPVGRISAASVWAHNLLALRYNAFDEENLADISQIR